MLIPQLEGHQAAVQAWSSPADRHDQRVLDSLRTTLITTICRDELLQLSPQSRQFLMATLPDTSGPSPNRRVLARLDRRIPLTREVGTRAAELGPKEPYPIPPQDLYFVGREAFVSHVTGEISRVMATRKSGLVLLFGGPPGIGISAVAQEVARDAAKQVDAANKPLFRGGVHYFALNGLTETARVTARNVAVDVVSALKGGNLGNRPDNELFTAFGRVMTGNAVLLVLDGARDPAHVAELTRRLPSCCVLVTSRNRGVEADPGLRFRVKLLERDDSVALLEEIITDRDGRLPETPKFRQLCDRLAGLCWDVPLALRVMGNVLATKTELDITSLLDLLVEEMESAPAVGLLKRLSPEERSKWSVGEAIKLSYQLLDSDTQRVLRLCHTVKESNVTAKELACAMGDLPVERVAPWLDRLVDHSLALEQLDSSGTMTYTLHGPVRLFATVRRAEDDPPGVIDDFRRRFIDCT